MCNADSEKETVQKHGAKEDNNNYCIVFGNFFGVSLSFFENNIFVYYEIECGGEDSGNDERYNYSVIGQVVQKTCVLDRKSVV